MDQEQDATPAYHPIPARFWWLKRIPLAMVILLIPLAGLRWWWGVYAERAYQAEIERYKVAGEPITSEDFDLPPVPDDQNAALLYEKAIVGLSLTKDQQDLIHKVASRENALPGNMREAEAILEASKDALSLCRRARELEGVNWGPINRGLGGTPPSLMPHQELVELLVASTIWLDQDNRCDEALETLLDALAYGRKISAFRSLIPSLLEHHISELTGHMVERNSGTWMIAEDGASPSDPTRQASRRLVRQLLNQLSDEQSLHDGFVWGLYMERLIHVHSMEIMLTVNGIPPINFRLLSWLKYSISYILSKPKIPLDGIRVFRCHDKWIEAAEGENYPEVQKLLPSKIKIKPRSIQWYSRPLSLFSNPQFVVMCERFFRNLTLRRMAAVTLAIRLYESDHGRRPKTLEELVPAYLSEIPQDPFADDGRTIGYRPEDDPPTLFSIGPHQVQYGDISCIRFTLYGATTTQPETSPSGS